MRSPRMTTRRWMLAVMATACLTAAYVEVARLRYISALREHSTYGRLYEEGRVTPLKYLEKSQVLMETQIALWTSKTDRTAFVSAHLDRVTKLMKREMG